MSVMRKRQRMKRTQISLPEEELKAVREFAARRGTSMSRVFRSGVKKELGEEEAVLEAMLGIVGIVKGADPDASEKHDEILYQ